MTKLTCELPEYAEPLFESYRYKVLYGGRGAARSWSIARILLILGATRTLRILCTRELQRSIQDSVHRLLRDQIELLNIPGYRVTDHSITHINGTNFLFEGLRYNVNRIKSIEGVDICWVEEAERITQNSWDILIPTIRKPNSEIWLSFNPDLEEDPTYQRFVVNPPPNTFLRHVGWQDNPWFPDVLRDEMEYAYRVDPESAEWVWGGQCRRSTKAAILHGKWIVAPFTPIFNDKTWLGPYHGGDWGFAEDPCVATRVWIHQNKLYIERESWRVKLEIDHIRAQWQKDIPDIQRFIIRADSARPETISFVKRHGLSRITPVSKWPGSVEDGIAYLRQFEQIIIHPRCEHAKREASLYSYKVDKQTGDVLPMVLDKHNHVIDCVRYALAPLIRAQKAPRSTFSGTSYPSN